MLDSTQRPGLSRDRDEGLLPIEADFLSFRDVARFVRRHMAVAAACVVASVALGMFYVSTSPNKYTARAQILIDPNTTRVLRDANASGDRSLDTAQVEGQVAILQSESLAFTVIGKLKLIEDPEFQFWPASFTQRLLAPVKQLISLADPAAEQPGQETTDYERLRTAFDIFFGNLDVHRVGVSYAINISYTSLDSDKAARIANEIADAYVQEQLTAMSRAAQQSSAWLEARLTQLRAQLNTAAHQLELFKAGREFRTPEQRRDLANPAPRASNVNPGANPGVMPGAMPGNVPAAGLNGATLTDTQRLPPLTDTTQQPLGQLTLAELESTVESYRKIYEAYQQAFTEAVQRQSFPVSNARVITSATKPLGKSFPNGKRTLAFAALVGLLAGAGIAALRQSMDHTVRSARQIRTRIGLPCLAIVPRLAKHASLVRRSGRARWFWRAAGSKPSGPPPPRGTATSSQYNFRVAIDVPFSPFSSALKTLRTAIVHADPRNPVRCVGITSGMPREGKSMVAGNLATLYALSFGRTLIIDTDIHNATVSRYFAPGAAVGLLEVVIGVAELDKAIVKGGGLAPDILPIAVREASPVSYEQLISDKMQTLLQTLRERYDMIIVDLPPVHPIVDGVAIAALLDGVVIVAEWGRTPVELLAEVTSALSTAQANILGVVITKADASAGPIRWRKDWGYGYYPAASAGQPAAAQTARKSAAENLAAKT